MPWKPVRVFGILFCVKQTEELHNPVGSRGRAVLGTAVLAIASGIVGWAVRDLMPNGGSIPLAKGASSAATVAVCAVEDRPYNLPQRFIAHAEPMQEVDLLPQVDGYIREIAFSEGDLVETNQLLYVLDDEKYRAIANQCKADLGAAQADLEAARAETRRTKRYWERMQRADERGITQKERDDAEAEAEKARADEVRKAAAVAQAEARLVTAEYDLKKTRIFAPIAGQIGKTAAHVGDYVSPSKSALAHIVQTDPIRVTFPLTDRAYVAWRRAKAEGRTDDVRTRLVLPDGSVYAHEGEFDFDDNQMSRETATVIMRRAFPNPDRLLLPNGYLTLLADRRDPPPRPCVPQQALFDLSGGKQGVFVLADDMTVEQRIVEVGEPFEGWCPVFEGVKAGEKVVISGVHRLSPGQKVELGEATPNPDIGGK